MGSIFMTEEDLPKQSTSVESSSQGGGVTSSSRKGTIAATCLEVYPDHSAALVSAPSIGTKVIAVSQSASVMKGGLCGVSSYGGVPIIESDVTFGYSYSDCIQIDLDNWIEPYSELSDPKEQEGWNDEITSDLPSKAFSPINIKKDPGERVYSVGVGGLKIGFGSTTLFYDYSAQITASSKMVEIKAKNFKHETAVETITVDATSEEGLGFKTSSLHSKSHSSGAIEGEDLFRYVRNYFGDVKTALKEEEFSLPSFPGMSMDAKDLVELKMIVNKYSSEDEPTEVTHSYDNRVLTVPGGGPSTINTKMLSVSSTKLSDFKKKGIKAKDKEGDLLIVYMEALSIRGETFKYQAGNHSEFIGGDRDSMRSGSSRDFMFGDYKTYFQQNISETHLPVLENSSYSLSIFSDFSAQYKGNNAARTFKEKTEEVRNTFVNYETYDDTDIQSYERKYSTVITEKAISRRTTFEKNSQVQGQVSDISIFLRDGGDTVVSMGLNDLMFGVEKRNSDGSTKMYLSDKYFVLSSPEGIVSIDTNYMSVVSKNGAYLDGDLLLDGKLQVKDDFFVKAKNIFLEASGAIYMESSLNYVKSDIFVASFSDYMYMFNDSPATFDEDGRERKKFSFYGTELLSFLQGEEVAITGGTSVSVTSEKNIGMFAQEQLNIGDSDGVDI